MRRFGFFGSILSAVLLLLLFSSTSAPALAAEDLAAVLPPETKAYLRVGGLAELIGEVEASNAVRSGPEVARLWWDAVARLYPMLEKELGVPAKTWEKVIRGITGVHWVLLGEPPAFRGPQSFAEMDGLTILEVGAVEDDVRKILTDLLGERAEFVGAVGGARVMAVPFEEDGPVAYYALHQGLLVATLHPERISAFLEARAKAPDKSLATLPLYRSSTLRAGAGSAVFLWLEADYFYRLIQLTMSRGDIKDFQQWSSILDLPGIKAGCMVSGGGMTQARVVYEPTHAWINVFTGEPGRSALAALVPAGSFFSVSDSGAIPTKWAALKKLLTDETKFPFAKDVKKGLAESERMLGASLDEIAAALGKEWGLCFPVLDERIDEDHLTVLLEIGDPEKFELIWQKFMNSELVKELKKKEGAVGVEKYGGYEIQRSGDPEQTDTPCMVKLDNVLAFSGDVRSLRAVIDAKTKGENMLRASGGFLSALPGTSSKFAALDFERMLMLENEFAPLLDYIRPGAMIAASADMSPGRIDLVANESLPEFIGILVAAPLLDQRYRQERSACLGNLRAIGAAVKKFQEANGRKPEHLSELVPDYLEKAQLVCPLDRDDADASDEELKISYESAFGKGEDQQWNIDVWCPHRIHRRLVLRKNGQAWSSSEESFLRMLRQMGLK